jgi:hypothetical protein
MDGGTAAHYIEPEMIEDMRITLPITNSTGQSGKVITLNNTDYHFITSVFLASKNGLIAKKTKTLNRVYSNGLTVKQDSLYLDKFISHLKTKAHLELIAFMNDTPLTNERIYSYITWTNGLIDGTRGIIEAKEIITDQFGRFKLEFNWPLALKLNEWNPLMYAHPDTIHGRSHFRLYFIYFHNEGYSKTFKSVNRPYLNFQVNEGTKPSIEILNDIIVKASYDLPRDVTTGFIRLIPIYDEKDVLDTIDDLNTPIFDVSERFTCTEYDNGKLITYNIIDNAFSLHSLYLEIIIPDQSCIFGYKAIYWVIDPQELQTPQTVFTNQIFLYLLFLISISSLLLLVTIIKRK